MSIPNKDVTAAVAMDRGEMEEEVMLHRAMVKGLNKEVERLQAKVWRLQSRVWRLQDEVIKLRSDLQEKDANGVSFGR